MPMGRRLPLAQWHRRAGDVVDHRWAIIAAGWGALYASYRAYYAVGGLAGLPGVLRSDAHGTFQLINTIAAIVLLLGAAAPLLMLAFWDTRLWPACVVACWAVAIGCIMHALIDIAQRVLSLAGLLAVSYPTDLWASVDRHAADLQDLLANEPWFLIEGLLFAWLALLHLRGRARLTFAITAVPAIAVFVASGMLTSTGYLARVVVG
jgi:hypothetical protein